MAFEDISLNDVLDTFAFIDDWDERYRYLIDLGRQLPLMDEAGRTDAFKVRGCQSQVWLVPHLSDRGCLFFEGDSDAHIVKGLVALMLLIFSGKTPAEILATDAKAVLEQLDLKGHLSPMRANGLFAMVERIGVIAKSYE